MAIEGTVVNGTIVLDGAVQLPEGARVQVEVSDPDDLAPPLEPYDREKNLAILARVFGGLPGWSYRSRSASPG